VEPATKWCETEEEAASLWNGVDAPAALRDWHAERSAFYEALVQEGAEVIERVTVRIFTARGDAALDGLSAAWDARTLPADAVSWQTLQALRAATRGADR
jgi:hypothetical protein